MGEHRGRCSRRVLSQSYPRPLRRDAHKASEGSCGGIGRVARLRSEAIADGIGQSLDKGSLTFPGVLFTTQVIHSPRRLRLAELCAFNFRIFGVCLSEVRSSEACIIEGLLFGVQLYRG